MLRKAQTSGGTRYLTQRCRYWINPLAEHKVPRQQTCYQTTPNKNGADPQRHGRVACVDLS